MNGSTLKQAEQKSLGFTSHGSQHSFRSTPTATPQSIAITSIQRKPACACGGSCPRCQSGFVQTKLKIGAPNDKYEQEADRVADQVMSMPEPSLQRFPEEEKTIPQQITPFVQRQIMSGEFGAEDLLEEEQIHAKPNTLSITPMVRRDVDEDEVEGQAPTGSQSESNYQTLVTAYEISPDKEEDEESVQTKRESSGEQVVASSLVSQIQSLRGGGSPLSQSERAFYEPRFGVDFKDVRIHTDTRANALSKNINARAFTLGHNIVFGKGAHDTTTEEGQRLLAHELVHVVQQGRSVGNRNLKNDTAHDNSLQGKILQRKKTKPRRPSRRGLVPPVATPGSIYSAWQCLTQRYNPARLFLSLPVSNCAQVVGSVFTVNLYRSGISSGPIFLKGGTCLDIVNLDNTAHTIVLVSSTRPRSFSRFPLGRCRILHINFPSTRQIQSLLIEDIPSLSLTPVTVCP